MKPKTAIVYCAFHNGQPHFDTISKRKIGSIIQAVGSNWANMDYYAKEHRITIRKVRVTIEDLSLTDKKTER